MAPYDAARVCIAMARMHHEDTHSPDRSRFLIWSPVRYLQQIPPPIRSLSLGILVNRIGGYVTAFLALILAARQVSPLQISLALIMSAVFAIAGSGFGGVLVSKIGGRRTIILSAIGSALFTMLLVFRAPFAVTVILVCFASFFNRAYSPAAATIIGYLSPPGERVKMFAFYQFSYNIGAAIGPLIGTYLLTRSLTALFLIDALTSGLYAIAALRIPAAAGSRPAAPRPGNTRRAIRNDYRYLIFCFSVTIVAVVYTQSSGALPLSFRSHHYSLQVLGLLLSANAVAVILFQLPISSIIRKPPAWLPLAIGGFLICGGYGLLLAGFTLPILVINVSFWTLGEMLVIPVRPVVAVLMSAEDSHGSYQGALSLAQTTGQVIGPSAGVFAYSFSPALPWALSCALLAPAAVLPFVLLRKISAAPVPGKAAPGRP
jgi:MFS family permease